MAFWDIFYHAYEISNELFFTCKLGYAKITPHIKANIHEQTNELEFIKIKTRACTLEIQSQCDVNSYLQYVNCTHLIINQNVETHHLNHVTSIKCRTYIITKHGMNPQYVEADKIIFQSHRYLNVVKTKEIECLIKPIEWTGMNHLIFIAKHHVPCTSRKARNYKLDINRLTIENKSDSMLYLSCLPLAATVNFRSGRFVIHSRVENRITMYATQETNYWTVDRRYDQDWASRTKILTNDLGNTNRFV